MKPTVLVITPVRHIRGVSDMLQSFAQVVYLDHPSTDEVMAHLPGKQAIFTNPNKSNVFIGREVMDAGPDLKVICTASTGTNHIDKARAAERGLPILALTEERSFINRISSTAEHAFALMLAALRHIPASFDSVKNGEWDYTRFIGRQMDHLTVGVIGYGRLGGMFSRYCSAFGATVLVHDPFKKVDDPRHKQVEVHDLLEQADVISLHVHATEKTRNLVDHSWLARMKSTVLLVNTARGDVVHEPDLIAFLRANPQAMVATDVVADEVRNKGSSPLIALARESGQVIITPHIGGMTREGQEIAYNHAATMLRDFFSPTHPG
ncbi:MAG: hydroxyacid dehydrogenase [Magnetococcales bacterium]|nr:hydroxyacid dehydrogenase [Magnetococcales bacterium]